MKDNLIYDHFTGKWISFEDTETWYQRREFMDTIKGIGAGILVSVILSGMVLLIALGLWGNK